MGTFTVTIDGDRLGAGTETSALLQVMFAAGRTAIKDGLGDRFIFPHTSAKDPVATQLPTSLTMETDVASGSPTNSETIGYRIVLTVPSTGGKVDTGEFAARPDGTTIDLTDLVADWTGDPIAEDIAVRAETARDEAVAAEQSATAAAAAVNPGAPNGTATLDGTGKHPESQVPTRLSAASLDADFVKPAEVAGEMATVDNNASSTFRTQQDARHAAAIKNRTTALGTAAWQIGPTAVNVARYGVTPAASAATNDAGMTALLADHTGAVTIAFPEIGTYQFTNPLLPIRSNIQVIGVSQGDPMMTGTGATRLRCPNGVMVAPAATDGTLISLRFADIAIDNYLGSAPLFDMKQYGIINSTFERCDLFTRVNGQPIFSWLNPINVYGIRIRDGYLRRTQTATVPAVSLTTNRSGGGVNAWTVSDTLIHSYLCNSSPFMRFETSGASYLNNMVFRDLIGEQNLGGIVHLYGVMGARFNNILEWDAAGNTYTGSLVFAGISTSSMESFWVQAHQVGTAGAETFAAGKGHLELTGNGWGHVIGAIYNGSAPGKVIRPATLAVEQQWGAGWGERVFSYSTSGTTLQHYMSNVIFTGTTALTTNLLDPTANSVPPGRVFTLKNRSTQTLTVAVTGGSGTIDGSASATVTTGSFARFMSDGTNYVRV